MNLKHYIIKKLGGVVIMPPPIPDISQKQETVFYGTSYSKLPKGITQEDLNKWYERKDEKDKEEN